MDRSTAIRLLAAIEAMTPAFSELDSASREISPEAERKALRMKVAQAMALPSDDMVRSIVRQYADLDPDKPAWAAKHTTRFYIRTALI